MESGELEERGSSKELAQVNKILALLATAGGIFEGEEKQCFQHTIASLLNTPTDGSDFQFQIGDLPNLICDISSLNSPESFNCSGDKTHIYDISFHKYVDYYNFRFCSSFVDAWKKRRQKAFMTP